MKRFLLTFAAVALVLLSRTSPEAAHDETAAAALVADVESGKAISEQCAQCHGANGMSELPETPHLAGQHLEFLRAALAEYDNGARAHSTMKEVFAGLSAQDVVDVTAYYASLEPFNMAPATAEAANKDDDPFAAVRSTMEDCAACHGEFGNIDEPGIPRIAGLHAQSLELALMAYRDGSRSDEVMRDFVEPLEPEDLQLIARYYSTIAPKKAAPPAAGDPLVGQAMAGSCGGCHGNDGNSLDPNTPNLAGQDAEYLFAALDAYHQGTRLHEAMQDVARPLTEDDMRNLSAFYAIQVPRAPERRWLYAREWAEKCDRCHGPNGNSTDPRFPILAGQSESYLVRALDVYHGGLRTDPMMRAMSFPLEEIDVRQLAHHYARQRAE